MQDSQAAQHVGKDKKRPVAKFDDAENTTSDRLESLTAALSIFKLPYKHFPLIFTLSSSTQGLRDALTSWDRPLHSNNAAMLGLLVAYGCQDFCSPMESSSSIFSPELATQPCKLDRPVLLQTERTSSIISSNVYYLNC